MAATYGYGGEFSSDEDIDKMEQQAERLAQSKFDSYSSTKPTRHQVEEAIESIKVLPHDQDVNISDELLAGLLDYYRTQRGPIVDSTRNLYKKIILRLVRGEQQQQASNGNNNELSNKDSNGNSINNNNNILDKRQQQQQQNVEVASSDEDEPMPPASSLAENNKKKFDSRVVYDPMEVDSEVTQGSIRANKQVDISSTEDEDDDDSDTESSSDDDDSIEMDVTPVKSNEQAPVKQQPQQPVPTKVPSQTTGLKPTEVVKKTAAATPQKESVVEPKRPYTRRSPRVAATRAARKITQTDVSSSKVDSVAPSEGIFQSSENKKALLGKFQVRVLVSALGIAALAFLVFYFRSDLTKSTDRLLKRAIKF